MTEKDLEKLYGGEIDKSISRIIQGEGNQWFLRNFGEILARIKAKYNQSQKQKIINELFTFIEKYNVTIHIMKHELKVKYDIDCDDLM